MSIQSGIEFIESASKLTICILTFNRPRALARQLSNLKNFPGQIFVLDGGEEELEIPDFQNKPKNLTYIKGKTFHERFGKAAELLSTDYTMTFSDDDLLVPTGINELLRLISKGEAESVFGRMVYAYPLKSSWGISLWTPLYDELKDRKVLDVDAELRIIRHFTSYSCVYFLSIMTSEAWKKTFSVVKLPDENMTVNPYALEIAYEFMGALSARSEIHNVLIAFRVKDFKPTWHSIHGKSNRPLLMSEWLNLREFQSAVTNYKAAIISGALKVSQEINAQRLIEVALSNFCSKESKHFKNHPPVVTHKRFFTRSNVKIALETLFIKIGFKKQVSNSKSLRIYGELRSQEIRCDLNEIESIVWRLFNREFKAPKP